MVRRKLKTRLILQLYSHVIIFLVVCEILHRLSTHSRIHASFGHWCVRLTKANSKVHFRELNWSTVLFSRHYIMVSCHPLHRIIQDCELNSSSVPFRLPHLLRRRDCLINWQLSPPISLERLKLIFLILLLMLTDMAVQCIAVLNLL